jgi:hypothetical protein
MDVQGAAPLSLDLVVDAEASTVDVPGGTLVAVFQDSAGPYLSISATTTPGPQAQPAVRIAPDAASDFGGSPSDACIVDVTSTTSAAVVGTFSCTALPSNSGAQPIDASGVFDIGVPPSAAGASPAAMGSPAPDSPPPAP